MPGRGGEAAIAGQQRRIEHFRKRVVSREVVPQLPKFEAQSAPLSV